MGEYYRYFPETCRKYAKLTGKTDYLNKMIVVFYRKMLYNIKVSAFINYFQGAPLIYE
jgi:hypothetical protein